MSKFITGEELKTQLCKIIWDAESTLLLVSPFIRLDDYFRNILTKQIENHKVHIIVVFGKNEGQVNKSLNKDDFEFLKKFPNISIVYQVQLHGKYYGNEKEGLITSINLHDHSYDNNIEFGVYSQTTLLDHISTKTDKDARTTCLDLAYSGLTLFVQRPVYEKKILSAFLGKNYVKSEVLHDITNEFYRDQYNVSNHVLLSDFPVDIEFNKKAGAMPIKEMPQKVTPDKSESPRHSGFVPVVKVQPKETNGKSTGYCIRTGSEIPFNPEKPLSYDSYKEWAKYENWDYPENYCHRTGQPTLGQTTFRKPMLNDRYKNSNQNRNY